MHNSNIRPRPMHSGLQVTRRTLQCLVAVLFLSVSALAAAGHGDFEVNEIVVFGDSLSDTGNVFIATSNPTPETPFQIPASPQWFEGRFTNGLVWHEVLAEGLGLPPASPSLMGGSNYAWGGANFGPGFSETGVPNVGSQIDQYLFTNSPTDDQLFILQAGNNDFIPPGAPADANALVDIVIDHVSTLAAAGARHFMVPTSDIRSNTPGLNPPLNQALFGPELSDEAIAEVLAQSKRFNRLLRYRLSKLERQLNRTYDGVTISYLNISLAGRLISKRPRVFGIDDVSTPALTSNFSPVCFCEGVVAEDEERYFFFDIVHPTATVHEVYGELALLTVTWKLAKRPRWAH